MNSFFELSTEEQIELYLQETGSLTVDVNDLVLFAYSKINEEV